MTFLGAFFAAACAAGLPTVDLSGETDRHTVIAAGTEKDYQGHPTTVMTDDGRIIAVWCTPHGGWCGPAAESADGGKTWKRIDGRFPEGFRRHVNCPSVYRLTGPDGKARIWTWSQVKMLPDAKNRPFAGTDEVKKMFKRLFHLCDTLPPGTSARTLRLRSAVLALLLAVVDAASSISSDRADERLGRLVEEMREHPERRYPLDRISEKLGFSPSNLLVRFKRLTGLPPHAFLLERRIVRAKEMLLAGAAVDSVAHRLGFSSGSHFSNQFKAVAGIAPSVWARDHRSCVCRASFARECRK